MNDPERAAYEKNAEDLKRHLQTLEQGRPLIKAYAVASLDVAGDIEFHFHYVGNMCDMLGLVEFLKVQVHDEILEDCHAQDAEEELGDEL